MQPAVRVPVVAGGLNAFRCVSRCAVAEAAAAGSEPEQPAAAGACAVRAERGYRKAAVGVLSVVCMVCAGMGREAHRQRLSSPWCASGVLGIEVSWKGPATGASPVTPHTAASFAAHESSVVCQCAGLGPRSVVQRPRRAGASPMGGTVTVGP